MAEIRLQIDGPATGESYANKARVFIQELENSPDAIGNLRSMYSMFPVEEAWASYNSALEDLRARNQSAFEVDFVIAKCNHTLSWLRNITVSSHWRLHIIDKCGDNFPDDFTQQQIVDSLPFKDVIFTQLTTDQTDGLGLMTGECTAYLYYILARYEEVPDFVIFLHDDAPRHLQIPFLNIVTKKFLWQKVFTGLSSLPLRASDNSLPLFLRYDHGRSTRLPSSLDFSLYHMSQSSWRGNLVGPPSPVDE
ncbi:hypothetical protein FOZ61_002458 [Perkinsus olseni]|uniref:Uncharacterized protein n=1 Tax=Perkinsus olseni TaxID=32597 RepID=A0A7J6LT04_PEROL|nr:hypothetical protein FOZ61_002458 [Perkinsus olseni]